MVPEDAEQRLLYLDACCLLNLMATGRAEELLRGLPFSFAIAEPALEEVRFLHRQGGLEQPTEREEIHPVDLIRTGALRLAPIAAQAERNVWLRFADRLGDGEAASCALAMVHGGGVATDDRRTLKLLESWAPEIFRVQTPELMLSWVERNQPATTEISRLLEAIRDRARFVPRREAPAAEWWLRHLPP